MSKRIVFAGTPEFAAANLSALLAAKLNIVGVFTQPDRPKGRGKKLIPSAVKQVAIDANIPVFQPLNFKQADDVALLAALKPDILIVVAYGLLLPKSVLDIPPLGCINVHASLLPAWRGAAPIERALEAGDSTSGVTIMQMDEGLDTGDMLRIVTLDLNPEMTGDSLREQLLTIGAEALLATIADIFQGNAKPIKQDANLASYAHKLSKEEALLDWQQDSLALMRKIHAFNSANICYSLYNDERIKISQVEALTESTLKAPGEIIAISKKAIDVATGCGILRLTEIQLPNAKRMPVAAVLNGKSDFFTVGQRFV